METIEYFKNNQVEKLYPSHCTQLPALVAFYNSFGIGQVKTGMILEF
jgi:7,8-dihydropterin-6-yl-methyl-4-(beta-D-ribofuranosyl)aminobenzene 5'-phosphate synthase